MKKMMLAVSIAASSLLVSATTLADTCRYTTIERSHPLGQYLDNKDGTVTDIVNGLMWQTCSLGQQYTGSECADVPTNFPDFRVALLDAADQASFAGYDDWRLPNIKELGSLVERACFAPAIDLTVFPSTPLAIYWSNTPDSSGVNDFMFLEARVIDFTDGTEYAKDATKMRLIRMVRDLKTTTN